MKIIDVIDVRTHKFTILRWIARGQ